MTKITIGARSSKLSLAYVAKVKDLLIQKNKELIKNNIEFKAIKTTGDRNQNDKIAEIGGKNLFCKEIEESLLANEIDIAVHSLKDMESIENNKLLIGAYVKRNDTRDVIISKKIKSVTDLKDGVNSIILGFNDWAGAWALDKNKNPLFPVVPGGARQRELSYRVGINITMYALTGSYKSDQIHSKSILNRLSKSN